MTHTPRATRLIPTLLLVVTLLAAGCGVGREGAEEAPEGEAPATPALPPCPLEALEAATEPVEVVLWHFLSASTEDALEQIAAEYNAAQTRVRVRVENQGTNNDELFRKYQAGVADGDLPAIAVLDETVTQQMVDSGTVLPAQSCIEADGYDMSEFLQAGVGYYTIDGALYPASLNLSTPLLYFNENHFRRAGLDPGDPPGTLAELRSTAQTIADAGVVETPLVLKVSPPLLEMWLTGAGVPMVDNDNGRGPGQTTAAAFDEETTVELFTWIREMVDAGLLEAVPDTPGQIDHYLAMAQGNASMTIETSTAAVSVQAFLGGDTAIADEAGVDAAVDLTALDIGASQVPGIQAPGRLGLGGGAWYITNTGPPEVQAAAWDFMKFFNSLDSQVTWNLVGSYLPFRTTAIEDPRIRENWDTTMAGSWLAIAYDQLLDGIDPAFPGPLMGPYEQFRQSMREAVDELLFQGVDPATAVSGAAADTTAALRQYAEEGF